MSTSRSIWRKLNGQQAFENDIDKLADSGYHPKPVTTMIAALSPFPEQYDLPIELEAQLAEDFAFVAAYNYDVRCVTVTCVEEARPDGLLLRLAANDGIVKSVKVAIREILSHLRLCVAKEITRDQCAEKVFDTVVRLNRNRILGRFSSKHFVRPATLKGEHKQPPSLQLLDIVKCMRGQEGQQHSAGIRTLQSDANSQQALFQEVEDSNVQKRHGAICAAVKAAYRLTEDGVSLPIRLERVGCPAATIASRPIQEIGKISKYWRISCSLARLSCDRKLGRLFADAKLETIQPFPTVKRGPKSRHVHAEVQMIVFYELHPAAHPPRIMGASKRACFLCNAFVEAHGAFKVLGAHNQVYCLWTVPDRVGYSMESAVRMQKTMEMVHHVVTSELQKKREGKKFEAAFPLQSLINLRLFHVVSRSVTPAASVAKSISVENVEMVQFASAVSQPASLRSCASKQREPSQQDSTASLSSTTPASKTSIVGSQRCGSAISGPAHEARVPADAIIASSAPDISVVRISSPQWKRVALEWLEMFVDDATVSGRGITAVDLSICRAPSDDDQNVIEVNEHFENGPLSFPIDGEGSPLEVFFRGHRGHMKASIGLSRTT